ncbi:ATP-binding cassette domain-containing protein, partial [Candidatus Bipolaricaulota bacterium]|nr:ATP-binding cassette domain-containing protein [Candidatus Bipolaricaulota bacterium]
IHLSKGQKRKIAIASALVLEKKLLLLDEPLAGLDRSGRLMVADLLRKAVGAGHTVILTAHTFDELLELRPEVYIIFNRKLFPAELGLPHKSVALFHEAGLLPPEKLLLAAELGKKGIHISVFQSDAEFVKKAAEMMAER